MKNGRAKIIKLKIDGNNNIQAGGRADASNF